MCDSGTVQVEIDKLWSFTRPDSSAFGIFFSQNCCPDIIRYIPCLESADSATHLNCIPHNGLAVLDNEAKSGKASGKCQ
jgi:hypothetical protein